jgi:hypothetical protein
MCVQLADALCGSPTMDMRVHMPCCLRRRQPGAENLDRHFFSTQRCQAAFLWMFIPGNPAN